MEDDRSCCVGTMLDRAGVEGRIGTSDSCTIADARRVEALSWWDDGALRISWFVAQHNCKDVNVLD